MNIFTKPNAKRSKLILAFSTLSLMLSTFSACKKTDDTSTPISYLSVVNASPTVGTYNIYFNDGLVNTSGAISFGGGVNYKQLTPGTYTVKFTTASSIDNVFSKSVTLSENAAYSFFLINKLPTLDGLLVQDDVSGVSTDKGFIRFINLSPDAPALDLFVTDASTSTISDKAYKSASGFVTVDPKTYSFTVKNKITGATVGKLDGAVVAAGVHYTIIAKGLINADTEGTDRGFGVQIITNQQ